MDEWRQYKRTGLSEMRPAGPDDSADNISVNREDSGEWSGPRNGMVARNPKNHADRWYVAARYFADNFEPVEPTPPETD